MWMNSSIGIDNSLGVTAVGYFLYNCKSMTCEDIEKLARRMLLVMPSWQHSQYLKSLMATLSPYATAGSGMAIRATASAQLATTHLSFLVRQDMPPRRNLPVSSLIKKWDFLMWLLSTVGVLFVTSTIRAIFSRITFLNIDLESKPVYL